MSRNATYRTEDRIELPEDVVDEVAARAESPTPADVRDVAFEVVDRKTTFFVEDGQPLSDAVAARVDE
jgi:hypothetical protein